MGEQETNPAPAARTLERRFVKAEMRVKKSGKMVGYAAVFDQLSLDLGGFREFIRKGFARESIKRDDIRGLFNHNPDFVLGRNRSGTLRLGEDDHGLHFEVEPPKTQWADDLRQSVDRGDIDQASFGFFTVRDNWSTVDGEQRRELIEAELFDVSVVTFPAYPQTDVSARSIFESFVGTMRPNLDSMMIAQMRDYLDRFEPNVEPGTGSHSADDAAAAGETGFSGNAHKRRKLQILKLKG